MAFSCYWVEVVCSVTDRVPVPGAATVSPLVSSVALTEAPLTVCREGAASKALVAVVVVVVVVRVPSQASQEQPVLEVSVVNSHGGHGTSSPKGGPAQEAGSDAESQGLLRETLPSIFPYSALKARTIVGTISRGLKTGRLGATKAAAVAGSLGVNKASTTNRSFRFEASARTSTGPLLLGIVGFASRAE